MAEDDKGMPSDAPRAPARSPRARGRRPVHGLKTLRRTVTQLTTWRLDGRSAVAVAVRRWKDDVRRDLGGDLTRAQETILELAAQSWVIISSLDVWIAKQKSLVTKKRTLLPVVLQRQQVAEGLARHLDRLGLERRQKDIDLASALAALHQQSTKANAENPVPQGAHKDEAPETRD